MEDLKVQQKIIELGKTIVKELQLDPGVDTLSKWMAHYLAELIIKTENSKSVEVKKELEKECCGLIIQLWDKRERIPIEKPTERLEPIISVLELFKERKHPFIPFLFPEKQRDVNSKNWVDFLKVIKDSSERIYNKSLRSMISAKVLEKDNQWIEKHGEFLSEEEKKIVDYLNHINTLEIKIIDSSKEKEKEKEKSDSEKFELLFSDLESFINEQMESLISLKTALMDKRNE